MDKLLEVSVDMLTVILIGNQSTGIYNNWMITPRGYLGWEVDGETKRSSDFTSSILARVNYGYRYIISITAGRELELLPPPNSTQN